MRYDTGDYQRWKFPKFVTLVDNMMIIAKDERTLKKNMEILRKVLEKRNMRIDEEKLKTMVVGLGEESYKYQNLNTHEQLFQKMEDQTKEEDCTIVLKTHFLEKEIITLILTYGVESWTTTQKQRNKMTSIEVRFLRKIELKTKMDRTKNETHRQNL